MSIFSTIFMKLFSKFLSSCQNFSLLFIYLCLSKMAALRRRNYESSMRSNANFDGGRHDHLALVLVSARGLVLPGLLSGRQRVGQDAAFERRRAEAGRSRRRGWLRVSDGGMRRRRGAAAGAHSGAGPLSPFGSVGRPAPQLAHQLVLDEAEDVLDAAALLRLGGQQPLEHAQGVVSEAAPLGRVGTGGAARFLPAPELLVEGVGRHGGLPGEVPCQHAEDQHAERPHVHASGDQEALGAVGTADLRCRVGDGAAHPLHPAADAPRHAEVSQLDAAALAVEQKHVFGFDVPMHQVFTVHEVQSQTELLHAALHHLLRQADLQDRQEKTISDGFLTNRHATDHQDNFNIRGK